MDGLTAVQSRIGQIQARFMLPAHRHRRLAGPAPPRPPASPAPAATTGTASTRRRRHRRGGRRRGHQVPRRALRVGRHRPDERPGLLRAHPARLLRPRDRPPADVVAAGHRRAPGRHLAEAQPGDLVFFDNSSARAGIDHVGIYLGGGKMIAAPQDGRRGQGPGRRQPDARSAGSCPTARAPPAASPAGRGRLAGVPYADLFTQAGGQVRRLPRPARRAWRRPSRASTARRSAPPARTGLMQFMPATAKGLGVDATDPASSIDGAARYLSQLTTRFGSTDLALAAYNAGPGTVQRYGGDPALRRDHVLRPEGDQRRGGLLMTTSMPLMPAAIRATGSAGATSSRPSTDDRAPAFASALDDALTDRAPSRPSERAADRATERTATRADRAAARAADRPCRDPPRRTTRPATPTGPRTVVPTRPGTTTQPTRAPPPTTRRRAPAPPPRHPSCCPPVCGRCWPRPPRRSRSRAPRRPPRRSAAVRSPAATDPAALPALAAPAAPPLTGAEIPRHRPPVAPGPLPAAPRRRHRSRPHRRRPLRSRPLRRRSPRPSGSPSWSTRGPPRRPAAAPSAAPAADRPPRPRSPTSRRCCPPPGRRHPGHRRGQLGRRPDGGRRADRRRGPGGRHRHRVHPLRPAPAAPTAPGAPDRGPGRPRRRGRPGRRAARPPDRGAAQRARTAARP